ncbi:hypothetical protein NEIPOLOT_01297 [Neisseria polysaccharea ATCC 43768]|nr:hypothetical protein NEIPOLOT_01297 [Neisseria polysaccharea ATCC 43768]
MQHITTKLFYFKITDISFFIDFKFHIFNILGILFQRKRNRLIKTIPAIHSGKTARNIRFPISTTIRYRTPPLPIPPSHPAKFHTQGETFAIT